MTSLRSGAFLTVFLLSGFSALAQSYLNLDQVEVRWPYVNISFNVECEGGFQDSIPRDNLTIMDNVNPVQFIEYRPDDPAATYPWHNTLMYCPAQPPSAYTLDQVKAGMHALLGEMRSGDELAIGAFSSAGTVDYIHNFDDDVFGLNQTVDSLPGTAATGVLQALEGGVIIHESSPNPQRTAIVLLTAGTYTEDDGTLQTIVGMAKVNRIKIFIAALDDASNTETMRNIAEETGGTYHFVPDPDSLAEVMREIAIQTSPVFTRFTATYKASQFGCPDLTYHTVNLQLENLCGGALQNGTSYRASRGVNGSGDVVRFALDTVSFADTNVVALSVYVSAIPITQLTRYQLQLDIERNDVEYIAIRKEGMALDGVPVVVSQHMNYISLEVQEEMKITGMVKLCELILRKKGQNYSYIVPKFGYVNLSTYCFTALFSPGLITVNDAPERWYVQHTSDTAFCEGLSVKLNTERDLTDIVWSTGDTAKSITVTQSGWYSYTATSSVFGRLQSEPQEVIVHPKPDTRIELHRDTLVCRGEGVITWYMMVGNSWRVMQHETGNVIVVDPGEYKAKIVSVHGCEVFTEPVTVGIVGIDRPDAVTESFEVFPVPNRGTFTVRLQRAASAGMHIPAELLVTNVLGAEVLRYTIEPRQTQVQCKLPNSAQGNGLYIVTLRSGGNVQSRLIPVVK